MSIIAHIETLEEKHARLEASIKEESQRPAPDFTFITTLKKQKLYIKEEMERLNHYREQTQVALSDQQATAS